MFIVLFLLLMLNVPVAFALFMVSIIFGLYAWGWRSLDIVFGGMWAAMTNWALVALPLFVYMSILMERCGIAEDMFKAIHKFFGRTRGSLAVLCVVLGWLIGAMSGVVAAGVVSLAILIYPLMVKAGYDKRFAAGVTLAAGTLCQIVPPSTNMIIYGVATGTSIAALFAGGLGVGTLMALTFIVYILIWSHLHPDKVPVLMHEEVGTLRERILALGYAIPPLIIILSVLGSIFAGMATPTEASGVGAVATTVYTIMRRRLNKKVLINVLVDTLKITSMVCWIVAGSQAFASVFTGLGGRKLVTDLMLALPHAKVTALALAIAIVIFLGMFLDTAPIALVAGPILTPVIIKLGYDPIWWGIVFCTTLLTAYITPPVGLGIYYFKGVRGDIPLEELFRAGLPFVGLMLIVVTLLIVFPDLALFMVRLLLGSR
jgi:tripartite ATP-independent transporter DctM subunit